MSRARHGIRYVEAMDGSRDELGIYAGPLLFWVGGELIPLVSDLEPLAEEGLVTVVESSAIYLRPCSGCDSCREALEEADEEKSLIDLARQDPFLAEFLERRHEVRHVEAPLRGERASREWGIFAGRLVGWCDPAVCGCGRCPYPAVLELDSVTRHLRATMDSDLNVYLAACEGPCDVCGGYRERLRRIDYSYVREPA